MRKLKTRKKGQKRRFRALLAEQLEPRTLLSGAPWTTTLLVDDHDADEAPQPPDSRVNFLRTSVSSKADGVHESGQLTDEIAAKSVIRGSATVVGKILNFEAKTEADVGKSTAEGVLEGSDQTSTGEGAQALASASYHVQGNGIGIFSITVSAGVTIEDVWAAETSKEISTDKSVASATFDIVVSGAFTVSVQALAGTEEMDFSVFDSGGHDYARTERGRASVTLSVITTGTYSVNARGKAECIDEFWATYGTYPEYFSSEQLNVRSQGRNGQVTFAASAEHSFISGYANGERAKETLYRAEGNVMTDRGNLRSSGGLTARASFDTESDQRTGTLPRRGPIMTATQATVRVAPPADKEAARQELWAHTDFLAELLFGQTI